MRLICTGDERSRIRVYNASDDSIYDSGLSLTIGRDHRNTIIVGDTTVSRYHTRLDAIQGRTSANDNSTNGTLLNGSLMPKEGSTYLEPFDRISVGKHELVFLGQGSNPLSVQYRDLDKDKIKKAKGKVDLSKKTRFMRMCADNAEVCEANSVPAVMGAARITPLKSGYRVIEHYEQRDENGMLVSAHGRKGDVEPHRAFGLSDGSVLFMLPQGAVEEETTLLLKILHKLG